MGFIALVNTPAGPLYLNIQRGGLSTAASWNELADIYESENDEHVIQSMESEEGSKHRDCDVYTIH